MKIITESGQHWVLQDEHGNLVPTGTFLKSNKDEQQGRHFELQGGRPPHKPSSTGRVYGKWSAIDENVDVVLGANSEYYPQVFNLAWLDRSPIPSDSSEKTDSPSGQLIGVIITAMINDGIKAAMGDLIKIEIDKLRDELVTAIENLENTVEDQSSEYLLADEHDYVESTDIEDLINSELDSRQWDIADHASDIEDLMQTSLQSEVQSIIQDMVRERAFVVSLNPE
tara:strand:+ start:79 stop:756 length:678 start_codon:yes stop_codon:yes gene_type:complete